MLPSTHSETHVSVSVCTAENAYPRFHNAILSTKYFDDETELAYYGYRYYSPELGRFINRDPMRERGGLNLYAVADNDPISLIDPLGLAGCVGCAPKNDCCCCCVNKLMFGRITRLPGNSPYMGHSVPVIVELAYLIQNHTADCTIQWKETWLFYHPDHPDHPIPGGYDRNACDLPEQQNPGSTCYPWHDRHRGTSCPGHSSFVMRDYPGILKANDAGPLTWRRKLVIDITITSGAGCKCANSELTLNFTQDLTVRDGVPDWEHSSP